MCAWALVCLATALSAEPIKQLKPTGYVNDFAGVLDASSSESIRNICQQIDQKAKAQIAIVTIQSLDGADIESYASDLYKAWGIGPKSSNRGVLILLAINDHKRRIEVGYGLEPILPDGKVGGFGREAVPLLRQDQYGPAVLLMTQRVAGVIAADAGITLEGPEPPRPPPDERPADGPSAGAIFLGIVIVLIVLAVLSRTGGSGLIWFLLGMFLNSGGRGGGGSSWGGGGSSWGGGGSSWG
ncbi:MAG TPA: TPM domain-containing protein, partial [Candidatus Angelobacter sp.]|nr:TPM domain-containing protein [Candidatus Angelobacter sp.]